MWGNNIKKIVFLVVLSVVFPLKAQKIKGLWVVRHNLTSPAKIDSVFQLSRQLAMTDLFLQVRGRGDAYYKSQIEPVHSSLLANNFDPLEYALQLGQTTGIRVHAWLNVFYIWSADSLPKDSSHSVFQLQNEIAKPVNGVNILQHWPDSKNRLNTEGIYLSPTSGKVQAHLLKIFQELLTNYPLDGIHLDYIRYPGPDYDVNNEALRNFKKQHVVNPLDFLVNPVKFSQIFTLVGYQNFYRMWRRFLMQNLTEFVFRFSREARKMNPQIIISAAVKPDLVKAHWDYYQNWDRWLELGLIDWAIPMNYAPDYKLFSNRIESYLQNIPDFRGPVGVALYNQSQEKIIRKIALVEALENIGYVLFSYDQLKNQPRVQMFIRKE
ncbi:MAG: hypothetical protein Kow0037_18610 [Calditrichia bacterium]